MGKRFALRLGASPYSNCDLTDEIIYGIIIPLTISFSVRVELSVSGCLLTTRGTVYDYEQT